MAGTTKLSAESPRATADKRTKKILAAAIRMALRVESPAVRHNTQTFNRGRYAAISTIPDYLALKDEARAIKENALERLPELVAMLEQSVLRNGGHFFLAKDAQAASSYVADVCTRARVKLAVKGKSITSEEIHLNHELESRGIEVAETDLAEFILQAADEQPSHIIAPAIHYSRERISELFRRVFHTKERLDTGEELTAFARKRLREKFLQAGAGITGANFVVCRLGIADAGGKRSQYTDEFAGASATHCDFRRGKNCAVASGFRSISGIAGGERDGPTDERVHQHHHAAVDWRNASFRMSPRGRCTRSANFIW